MRRRGFSMVGVIAAMVIIALLALVFMYGGWGPGSLAAQSPRADKRGNSIPALAMLKAHDEECRSDLQQVRAAIQVYDASSDDVKLQSLDQLNLPANLLRCPIGKEPYVFDPNTQEVHCPHPGHKKY